MSIFLTIVIFALILGLLIFVHEVGHFVMAKRAGMKVEEFGFGFPPRLFGFQKGETTYSINLIPLGGFVKILGEDGGDASANHPRAFMNKGFWQRLSVLLAGVVMNMFLAWFLFFLGFWQIGMPVEVGAGSEVPPSAQLSEEQLAVVAVLPESPAEDAGFKAGDVIANVDGVVFSDTDSLIEYNHDHAEEEIVYTLKRGEEVFKRKVVPRADYPEGSGSVGFALALIALGKYPLWEAFQTSWVALLGRTSAILGAFGLLLKQIFTSGQLISGFAGPVGIAVLTRDFAQLGLPYLTQFTAVLSINLAIINAFPFPALDGGRVMFLIIEKIRGARSLKWEQVANAVGFALLILLMVVVTFRDVDRYSEQFRNLFERLI